MELYDLLLVINPDYCLEIYDENGYLLQDGVRGTTWWEDVDRKVHMIYPHNETIRIYFEMKLDDIRTITERKSKSN